MKPILPPRAGYVERIDSDGNHVYVKVDDGRVERSEVMTVDEMTDCINSGIEESLVD
nr:MAG TPA: hypothetical protein [Caudoviricetes sp.]